MQNVLVSFQRDLWEGKIGSYVGHGLDGSTEAMLEGDWSAEAVLLGEGRKPGNGGGVRVQHDEFTRCR